MVRIATSFIGAAVLFSSLVSALPTRRQDINPIVPNADGSASSGGDLNTIDLGGVATGDPNGSAGGTVDIPSSTDTVPVPPAETNTVPTPPEETVPPQETVPAPPAETAPVESYPPSEYPPSPPSEHPSNYPMYGSGNMDWQAGYEDCVQTCFVEHPVPPTVVTLPASHDGQVSKDGQESKDGDVSSNVGGTGVTHEIMAAPADGVFHYAPAFVKANVGDEIRFTVVTGSHSITQSSPILPCNASVGGFDSGVLNAGQTFSHIVKDDQPVFFFSNVDGECQKGMFGGVNANTGNEDSQTTVAALMPQWANSNPDIKAALAATESLAKQTGGMTWGNSIETKDIPTDLHAPLASSVLFTRAFIGQNPEMVGPDGVFHPTGDVVVPRDASAILAIADQGGYATPDQAQAPVSTDAPTPENQNLAANNDASGAAVSLTSSRFLVAGIAVVAAFFAL